MKLNYLTVKLFLYRLNRKHVKIETTKLQRMLYQNDFIH